MIKYLIPFVAISLFLLNSSDAKDRLQVERRILNNIFEGYDNRIRPNGENGTGPVIVEVNTFVRSINNIDDVNMVYDTQLTFRQSWYDKRLNYSNKAVHFVTLTDPDLLWKPDIFFSNEQSGHFHNMLLPNILIRIYPDGNILYSIRISLRLSCPMNLVNYPLDSQVCSVKAASYGYTTEDIVFLWKARDPVQMTKTLGLSKFQLTSYDTEYCASKTNTGEYSCIKVDFSLTRNFFYYMVQVYMPTTCMVLLSWLVFWLNPKYTNIRFGIILGILISSIIITTSIHSRTPQVSYTKAIDVWIGVCVCFIFGCMLELCLVVNALTKEEYSRLQNQLAADEMLGDKNSVRIDDGGKSNQVRKLKSTPLKWLNKYSTTAQRIDVFSRFFFPALFVFFNFVYWLKYATSR